MEGKAPLFTLFSAEQIKAPIIKVQQPLSFLVQMPPLASASITILRHGSFGARILPAGPIPASPGDSLYLSNLDDMIGARVFTPTVYFYRSNSLTSESRSLADVLHDALAAVLVPYYPLSGRMRETKNGKLEIFFEAGQGAIMVEAHSEMVLADLGDLTVPNPGWQPLVYRFPNEEPYKILDMPLLIAQVTMFSCGGFSLGLRLCHCICDGLGAMQVLRAWAATTKRIDDGSSLTKSLWIAKPVQRCYKISPEFQARVKTLAKDEVPCTTFDAMAAHIWRSWVKALDVKPEDYQLRLTFSVNGRQKLKNPPLKDGFYGNAVCVACAVSSVSELIGGSLSNTASLVHEARLGVSEEYLRSTIDYVEVHRPMRLEFGGKLTITQWTRFSIYESADFGWGRPLYAGPIDLTPTPQVCILLPGGESDPSGTMVVCICLPKSASEKFRELFSLID
ncbi:hypothetical protein EUGRSUZ_C01081 [Eucalyptus grandis]|uniref:Uncharacterized protein n=1 Tax=Eucalyptus grandis TaxID=71139 RepID=A0ACC3LCJ8_EUCGR|nr:hypothetical protein EUGRSUZ_C01081 [Eucalyptus grandis]